MYYAFFNVFSVHVRNENGRKGIISFVVRHSTHVSDIGRCEVSTPTPSSLTKFLCPWILKLNTTRTYTSLYKLYDTYTCGTPDNNGLRHDNIKFAPQRKSLKEKFISFFSFSSASASSSRHRFSFLYSAWIGMFRSAWAWCIFLHQLCRCCLLMCRLKMKININLKKNSKCNHFAEYYRAWHISGSARAKT